MLYVLQLFFFYLPLRSLKTGNALNLIIDIGNTTAKVALFDGEEMVEVLTESNQSLGCLKTLWLLSVRSSQLVLVCNVTVTWNQKKSV